MKLWIELHCEKPADIADSRGRVACYSMRGDSAGTMTWGSPAQAVKALLKDALTKGWTKIDGQVVCPTCSRHWKASEREAKS